MRQISHFFFSAAISSPFLAEKVRPRKSLVVRQSGISKLLSAVSGSEVCLTVVSDTLLQETRLTGSGLVAIKFKGGARLEYKLATNSLCFQKLWSHHGCDIV